MIEKSFAALIAGAIALLGIQSTFNSYQDYQALEEKYQALQTENRELKIQRDAYEKAIADSH